MNTPITLPTTLEDFTAYQEQLINRRLTEAELEVTAAWLGVFNNVGVGSLNRAEAIEKVDYLIGQADDPVILRFLSAARCWLQVGKELGKAMEGYGGHEHGLQRAD